MASRLTGGVEVQLHSFLNSVLDIGESSVSRPDGFNPGRRALWRLDGTQSLSGRGGEKKILSLPLPGVEPWLYRP